MKKLVLSLLVFALLHTAYAQKAGNVHIGGGLGVNNPSGAIGFVMDVKVAPKLLAEIDLGLGWGTKVSVNAIYEYEHKSGWFPLIGFSHASGKDSVLLKDTEVLQAGVVSKKDVSVSYKPVDLINLGIRRQWLTAKDTRMFINLGYSIPLTSNPFTVRTPNTLLNEEEAIGLKIASPGGLIVGFGVTFAL